MGGVLEINEKENYVLVSVDSKIYSLDVIYTASYVFLERAYLILEGDPKKEVLVKLTAKTPFNNGELNILGKEFLNELVNYGVYKNQSEKNKEIRQILLQRALLTNSSEEDHEESLREFEDLEGVLGEIIDDPEGIAIPWEEKYEKKRNENENSKR